MELATYHWRAVLHAEVGTSLGEVEGGLGGKVPAAHLLRLAVVEHKILVQTTL